MKKFYDNLQEEMRDLQDLENELKDERVIKLLDAKKEEFFTKTINEVEEYKTQYEERETQLVKEIMQFKNAIDSLNTHYKNESFYEEYKLKATLYMAAKSEELQYVRLGKVKSIERLNDTIGLLNQIKNGSLSTPEFSKKLEGLKASLNGIEAILNYKSPLAKNALEEINKKNQVKEEKVEKQEDIHPTLIDGEKVYNGLSLIDRYKAKKEAYEITEGRKPGLIQKIGLFVYNKSYSDDAKEYLSNGEIKANKYVQDQNLNEIKTENTIKDRTNDKWIKARAEKVPENMKDNKFRRIVKVAELGVLTTLLTLSARDISLMRGMDKDVNAKTITVDENMVNIPTDQEIVDSAISSSIEGMTKIAMEEAEAIDTSEIETNDMTLEDIEKTVSVHENSTAYNQAAQDELPEPKTATREDFKKGLEVQVVTFDSNTAEQLDNADEQGRYESEQEKYENEQDLEDERDEDDQDERDEDDEDERDEDDEDERDEDDEDERDEDDEDERDEDDEDERDEDEEDERDEDDEDERDDDDDYYIGEPITVEPPVEEKEEIGEPITVEPPVEEKEEIGEPSIEEPPVEEKEKIGTQNPEPEQPQDIPAAPEENLDEEIDQILDEIETEQSAIPEIQQSAIGMSASEQELQSQIDSLTNEIGGIIASYKRIADYNVDVGLQVTSILQANGVSKEAAAGIAGNMFQESRFSPNAYNSAGYTGVCQWSSGRWATVSSWMQNNGKSGLAGQVEAALYAEPNYAGIVQKVLSAQTVEEACRIWQKEWEVGADAEPRQKAAQVAYKAMQRQELINQLAKIRSGEMER